MTTPRSRLARRKTIAAFSVALGATLLACFSSLGYLDSEPVAPAGDASSDTGQPNEAAVDSGRAGDAADATTDAAVGDTTVTDAGLDSAADANGCDADTMTSGENCGACGHDCQGGGCSGGICSPITLDEIDGGHLTQLVLDDANVYVTDGVQVWSVPQGGGAHTTVYAGSSETIQWMAIDLSPSTLYWTQQPLGDGGAGELVTCPATGCTTPTVLQVPGYYAGVAVDPADHLLYFVTAASGDGTVAQVLRCTIPGCAGTPLKVTGGATGLRISGIALDGLEAFWVSAQGVFEAANPGTGYVPIAGASNPTYTPPALSPSSLFWCPLQRTPSASSFQPGTIEAAPISGDGGMTTLVADAGTPISVVATSTRLYYADFATGTIATCTLPACADVSPLAQGQLFPYGLAQDAVSLYWVNNGDGRVMKVAK
jgi:hypothetical protein